jgi:hypothetical protein
MMFLNALTVGPKGCASNLQLDYENINVRKGFISYSYECPPDNNLVCIMLIIQRLPSRSLLFMNPPINNCRC